LSIRLFHIYQKEFPEISEMHPASLRERIFAQLIDGIFLGIFTGIYYYLLSRGTIYSLWVSPMFPFYLLQPSEGLISNPANWWWGGYFLTISSPWLADVYLAVPSLVLMLLYGCYYTYFHYYYGQTPGKMIKGLVVLKNDRNKLTFRQSLQRWILYLFSLLPLGTGFWQLTRQPAKETWHDRLAGTTVWSFVNWQ
jgi:uncharacterized RDD family membrane protein YckC